MRLFTRPQKSGMMFDLITIFMSGVQHGFPFVVSFNAVIADYTLSNLCLAISLSNVYTV